MGSPTKQNMRTVLAISCALLACLSPASAAELRPETAAAFDNYIAALETKWAPRNRGENLIQVADTPERQQRMKAGDIVVRASRGNGQYEIPNGLINDWVGGFFLPGATLRQVIPVMQDYSSNKIIYAPAIVESTIRSHKTPDQYHVFLRIQKSKFTISEVLNSEHDIRWTYPSATKAICRSFSTRIAEVTAAGKPDEHELPVGNDRGIVWRIYAYWFLEERDGGVYVEFDSITLSREIPLGMAKVFSPMLQVLSTETLKSSLLKCRRAVQQLSHAS